MRGNTGLVAVLALTALGSGFALAAEDQGGRYTMTPKGDDMVRLDTETGDVSICSRKDGDWACRAMPESEKSLRSENDRLIAQNKGLKDEIKRLEETLGIDEPKPGDSADAARPKFQLPSEADVDKAFDYLEGMFRKFRDRLKRLEEPRPDGTQL